MLFNINFELISLRPDILRDLDLTKNSATFRIVDAVGRVFTVRVREYNQIRDDVLAFYLAHWKKHKGMGSMPPFTTVYEVKGYNNWLAVVMHERPIMGVLRADLPLQHGDNISDLEAIGVESEEELAVA